MDVLQTANQLTELASRAVDIARAAGVDEAEAGASHDEGLSVTVRMGELESIERQQDRGLAITVYKAGSKGSASTGDFSSDGLRMAVDKAVSIATFTTADKYAGLADAESMATNIPDLDLYHPWAVDVAQAEDIALEAESAARERDGRIDNSEGAVVSSGGGVRAYVNSHGFRGAYPTSSHSTSVSVVAREGDALERDYWYSAARNPELLDEPASIGTEAADRAVRRLGARRLTTRTAPVVFVPELGRSLFGHLAAALRGTSQYRKASFLLDCVGDQVFPEAISIEEDPHIPGAFGSAPFDGEGVSTRRRDFIAAGAVQGYVLSAYSARRLGLPTTGNAGGTHNLIVAPTAGDLASILKDCGEALLVTELLGQGVNIVTGDYSRGAAGFWVQGGEISHPVNEVTIAGNLRGMFQGIRAVGSDIDRRGSVHSGSVLIEAMTIAGD